MAKGEPGSTILALNSGSSSLKFGLYRVGPSATETLLSGEAEAIGGKDGSFHAQDSNGNSVLSEAASLPNAREAIIRIGRLLADTDLPVPSAIGHRVVHGGHAFEPGSGAWLIAQMMLSKHSLAKQLAERFGPAHGRCAESVGELQISERIAIVLNTLALKAADFLPLATAKGELLRLLRAWLAAPLIIALRPRAAPRRSSCDGIMACPGAFPSV
jgi:hypothetical protein